ncbi:crosslink repair DNA glycosylase YcaQ family protein [Microbacterium sp. NPDC089189]|uniref:DNA glycosylase AlkZ-like family protein n=1 Tax=Microbacterium sp. NPDC089189 TaxID=3154972 RepID=UPI00342ADECA
MTVTWDRALAWRADQQFLTAPARTAAEVVGRLISVPANSGDPELSVSIRLAAADRDAVATALASRELIAAYAFGGAVHLMTPAGAADVLALRGASRQWERRTWQTFYELAPERWDELRTVVADALSAGPLTQSELAAAVAARSGFAHLREHFSHPSQTILKPLAWQGVMSFGPRRDGTTTFQSLALQPGWPGLPEVDEAGPRMMAAYLTAYGPASRAQIHRWFTEGLSVPRRRVDAWLASLGSTITQIDVDDASVSALTATVPAVRAHEASDDAHLLPGYDRWVFGPGTAEETIVPAAHRTVVSRGANVAVVGGRVRGTWRMEDGAANVAWFDPTRPPGGRGDADRPGAVT